MTIHTTIYSHLAGAYSALRPPAAEQMLETGDRALSEMIARSLERRLELGQVNLKLLEAAGGLHDAVAILRGLPNCSEQDLSKVFSFAVVCDQDAAMITDAKRKIEGLGLADRIRVVHTRMQDLADTDLPDDFDIANISHVFAQAQGDTRELHFEGVMDCLKGVHSRMNADGEAFVNCRNLTALFQKGNHSYDFSNNGMFARYTWTFAPQLWDIHQAEITTATDEGFKNITSTATIPMAHMEEHELHETCNRAGWRAGEVTSQDKGEKGIFISARLRKQDWRPDIAA